MHEVSMHQKYAKTLKQKVEIYANFPTEKFLSKVMHFNNKTDLKLSVGSG